MEMRAEGETKSAFYTLTVSAYNSGDERRL